MTSDQVAYALPTELRAIADLIETLNETARGLEKSGNTIYVDNVTVTDSNGVPLGVLSWRTEADSYGVALR